MGAGKFGRFGKTSGAMSKIPSRFTLAFYKGSVKVDGQTVDVSRRVYQRHDIDLYRLDAETGMTNLERMESGRPPIGADGQPIQLHHVIQKETGPVVEIRETTHQEYYSVLHGLVGNGSSFRNNRSLAKQYNNFRAAYWKWRAKMLKESKK